MLLSIVFLIIGYYLVTDIKKSNLKNVKKTGRPKHQLSEKWRFIIPGMGLVFGLSLSIILGTFCPKTYWFNEDSVEYIFGVSTSMKFEDGNTYPTVRYYINNQSSGILEWKETKIDHVGFVINNSTPTPLLATYYLKNSGIWFWLAWPPREIWMQLFMLPMKMFPKGNIQ